MQHKRVLVLTAAVAATAVMVSACSKSTSGGGSSTGSSPSSSSSSTSSAPAAASGSSSAMTSGSTTSGAMVSSGSSGGSSAGGTSLSGTTLVVGSANFGENVILMDIYADALKAKGASVTTKPKIGSREVYLPALKDGSIDLVPEYSGTLLQYFDKNSKAASSAEVFAALPAAIGADLKVLTPSAAEDKDAICVTQATATKYSLKSIADLSSKAGDLILGAAPEFKTRPDGIPGLKSKYNVSFGTFKPLDAGGPLTIAALKNGQVDAADVFSTDANIATDNFVCLDDPQNLYIAQNVLPLINAKKDSPAVEAVLNAVSAKLTTQTLVDLNKQAGSGTDPDQLAQSFLKSAGLS